MISNEEFSTIESLELDPVKAKLIHESGEGWSAARADAVEGEYRRFLILAKKYPDDMPSPSVDVDTFWHYHILHTMKYAADCEQAFGYFLHHVPHVESRGEHEAGAMQHMADRMRSIYLETFGEDYDAAARRCAERAGMVAPAAAVNVAYCGVAAAASAYCGVAKAAPAYCGVAAAKPAYCGVAAPAPAYCGVASTKPSYCGVAAAKPAYCGVATAKPAYCGVATAKPAYCGVATAKPAYCGVAVAKPAYCGVAVAKPAYCGVAAASSSLH